MRASSTNHAPSTADGNPDELNTRGGPVLRMRRGLGYVLSFRTRRALAGRTEMDPAVAIKTAPGNHDQEQGRTACCHAYVQGRPICRWASVCGDAFACVESVVEATGLCGRVLCAVVPDVSISSLEHAQHMLRLLALRRRI